jgi:hypothetical protein
MKQSAGPVLLVNRWRNQIGNEVKVITELRDITDEELMLDVKREYTHYRCR